MIRKPFDELIQKTPDGLPNFYKVNGNLLSRQGLQKDRFSKTEFTYYFTKYRQKISEELIKDCKMETKFNRFSITGLQCSGKSFFLADFVLRQRALGEKSDFRILYVNATKFFLQEPKPYLFVELLAAVCFDIDLASSESESISELPSEITSEKQIVQCLKFLLKRQNEWFQNRSLFTEFLEKLKDFYNSKGKKLILLWDQINELFKIQYEFEKTIFKAIAEAKNFDIRIVSASNTNEEMEDRKNNESNKEIEINPYLSFADTSEGNENENELYELILAEAKDQKNRPVDIKESEIAAYVKALLKLIDNSIIEYFYFKFTAKNICSLKFEDAKKKYDNERKRSIQDLEEKYRNKFIETYNNLCDYHISLKKILTFQEYANLKKPEEKVFLLKNI